MFGFCFKEYARGYFVAYAQQVLLGGGAFFFSSAPGAEASQVRHAEKNTSKDVPKVPPFTKRP